MEFCSLGMAKDIFTINQIFVVLILKEYRVVMYADSGLIFLPLFGIICFALSKCVCACANLKLQMDVLKEKFMSSFPRQGK